MGIKLDVGETARIDFSVGLGSTQESVTVEGGRSFVATEDVSVGTVVGRDFLRNLPLNGRGLLTLLEAVPGVVVTPANALLATGQFSVNGQRASSNYVMVDGIGMNSGPVHSLSPDSGASGVTPGLTVIGSMHNLVSLEALEEFRLLTSGSNAEFSRMPGAQLLLSTRSGTNQAHGSLFWRLRNDRLDANDWFGGRRRVRAVRFWLS
jgi:hypothetical protein